MLTKTRKVTKINLHTSADELEHLSTHKRTRKHTRAWTHFTTTTTTTTTPLPLPPRTTILPLTSYNFLQCYFFAKLFAAIYYPSVQTAGRNQEAILKADNDTEGLGGQRPRPAILQSMCPPGAPPAVTSAAARA